MFAIGCIRTSGRFRADRGILVGALGALALAGCSLTGSSSGDFARHRHWRDAQVVQKPCSWSAELMEISIRSGERVVLESTTGWARPWHDSSTAHSSHESIFIELPAEPAPGSVFVVSSAEGTLAYDAFSARSFWRLVGDAEAHVTIREVWPDRIRAQVRLTAVAVGDSHPESMRREVVIDREEDFRLARQTSSRCTLR